MSDNDEGELIIRAGTVAIKKWREINSQNKLMAAKANITSIDLSGADLSNSCLKGVVFDKCDLRYVNFAGSDLRNSKFNFCILSDADFRYADVYGATIIAKNLDGAKFGCHPNVSRIASLSIIDDVERDIFYDMTSIKWYDAWFGWERLRFLSTIRIFVPAYASLAFTVFYVYGIAWYNQIVVNINEYINKTNMYNDAFQLPEVTLGWMNILVFVNFLLLAVAATSFLACPPQVLEFTRIKWIFDLKKQELLYDLSSYQNPFRRILCASTLFIGGALSAFLLAITICRYFVFVIQNLK